MFFQNFQIPCVFPVWNYFSQFSLFSLCSGNTENTLAWTVTSHFIGCLLDTVVCLRWLHLSASLSEVVIPLASIHFCMPLAQNTIQDQEDQTEGSQMLLSFSPSLLVLSSIVYENPQIENPWKSAEPYKIPRWGLENPKIQKCPIQYH